MDIIDQEIEGRTYLTTFPVDAPSAAQERIPIRFETHSIQNRILTRRRTQALKFTTRALMPN